MGLNLSWEQILTCFAVLFAVIDMPGNIPVIVNLKNKTGKIQSEKATIAATILLITFLFFGKTMLRWIGIDVESFAIAGSFVIFVIAVEMILGIEIQKNQEPGSVSIVPIAFPLIAGAGSLTTVLSLRADNFTENIIIGIVLNMLIVYLVLKFAGTLEKIMGPGVINVLKKVFGVILLAVAVKLFTQNLNTLIENINNY